jgi:hypothetical protein
LIDSRQLKGKKKADFVIRDHPRLQGPIPGNQREEVFGSNDAGIAAAAHAVGSDWLQQRTGGCG